MNNKTIYCDNNATTKVCDEALNEMIPFFSEYYGNPSSLHKMGLIAERAVKKSRLTLAKILKAEMDEIYFTSGGTESVNTAIKGIARANSRRGKHIISTKVEHESVLECLKQLEKEGFEITLVKPNSSGVVETNTIINEIRDETVLISVMHVNNELGSINNINEIARKSKEKNKDIFVFCDGAQSFGKLQINLKSIDAYSISAHKLHGPKGIGALYIKKKTLLTPILAGGGQERTLRSGTENVPGIVGFGKAAEIAYKNLEADTKNIKKIKNKFLEGLQTIPEASINSPASAIHSTLNISINGVPSEVMVYSLEEKGIYVSSGSACGGHKPKPSHVLKAASIPENRVKSALRFSFSRYNTPEEVRYILQAIKDSISEIKSVMN